MSPVRSKAQFKFLAINKPKLLKKWQKEAPRKFKNLMKKVKKK